MSASEAVARELGLSEFEVESFRDAFRAFDRDGDGTVTSKELHLAIKMAGATLTEEQVKQMMKEVDADGSGEVDFKEFCQLMLRFQKVSETDVITEIKEGFKAFDKDGSGTVSIYEIKHVLEQVGEYLDEDHWQVMEQMVKELDADGDGEITYDEFLQLIAAD
eukprot:EG_transcript_26834